MTGRNSDSCSSSSDDDDVVVMRVCATRRCQCIKDLQYDEETNESYCGNCRALFARTHTEGFRILLSEDDLALVDLIFNAFDKRHRGYWTYKEWCHFQEDINNSSSSDITDAHELREFFVEEYDIVLRPAEDKQKKAEDDDLDSTQYVIRLEDLENMYGGFAYNNVDALVEDADALQDLGVVNTDVLE